MLRRSTPRLEPELDYSTFSISISFEQIPALPGLLANLSEADVLRLRTGLRAVHRYFIWDEGYGRAYELV